MFLVGALAALALPAPALATHMSMYSLNPVEHDDQGRVDEPDGAATSVLGPEVRNCVASFGPGQRCVEDAALPPKQFPTVQADVIAPGCSANDGRHVSGECGLYTVGMGTGSTGNVLPPGADDGPVTGSTGRTDGKSPGRLTPTTTTVLRFLDARISGVQINPQAGGTHYLDYNHKLQDRGVSGALAGANPDLGDRFVAPGGSALWAWYGTWADKNGNGVVDFLGSGSCVDDPTVCGPDGGVKADNEWKWIGRCIQFDGSPAPAGNNFCAVETVAMPVWITPGDHHAFCYGIVVSQSCGTVPVYPNTWIDWPGRDVFCFVDTVTAHQIPIACYGDIRDADEFSQEIGGDPLLGPQDSVRRDSVLSDRTGDATDTTRHWVYGNGWATYFYDQSLAVTTTMIAAVTPQTMADTSVPTYYDVSKFIASDVDRYRTWSPAANDLLQNTVKPAARGKWVLVRDSFVATGPMRDAPLSQRVFYDQCDTNGPFNGVCAPVGLGPARGRVDDAVGDPGYPREPNNAQDLHPGAVLHACANAESTFRGFCNDYTGYAAGWHAWLDVRGFPAVFTNLAWGPPGGNCVMCVTGPPTPMPMLPMGHVRGEGDHARAFQPGTHVFAAVVGAWHDRPQQHDSEIALDVVATLQTAQAAVRRYDYMVGPDGWVGDVVNTTGALRSRGYGPVTCTIGGQTRLREFAECDPYLGGTLADPQSYSARADLGGEFCGARVGMGGNLNVPWSIVLHPDGGVWTVPILVWRNFDTWRFFDTGAIEDWTGSASDVVLRLRGWNPYSRDLLILPEGNAGLGVTSTMEGDVVVGGSERCPALREFVRDVDVFAPYGS